MANSQRLTTPWADSDHKVMMHASLTLFVGGLFAKFQQIRAGAMGIVGCEVRKSAVLPHPRQKEPERCDI